MIAVIHYFQQYSGFKFVLDNMHRIFILSFVLLASGFIGCRRNLHPVPDIPFNVNINVNLPSYSGLQSIGGFAYVENAGVKGLVVYRRTMDEFVAFDRMSPAQCCKKSLIEIYFSPSIRNDISSFHFAQPL